MKLRIENKWRWLVALGAVFVPGIVTGALNLPFTFSPGNPIRASEVNANFEALRARVDALSGAQTNPVVGTLTIAGLVASVPIRKFQQSVTVDYSVTVGTGQGVPKPALSDIIVVRDAGDGTPALNLSLHQGKHYASADIVIGSFAVHLTSVLLTSVSTDGTKSTVPQETLALTYQTVDWSWQPDASSPKKVVSYDVGRATGGGVSAAALKYGYFAPGVAADPSFVSVTGYSQNFSIPVSPIATGGGVGKPVEGPLSIQKGIGTETLDELSYGVSGSRLPSVDLEWFTGTGKVNNSVKLANVSVSAVSISTKDDGSLTESVAFVYQTINWEASSVKTGWDVTKNAAL